MFKNINIKSRLMIVIAILSVSLLVIGGMGILGMSKANEGLRTVYDNSVVPMEQISNIQKLLLDNRLRIAVSLVTPVPEVIQKNAEAVEQNIAEIGKIWEAYTANSHLSAEDKALADKFAEDRKRFVQEGLKPTVAALRANDVKLASSMVVDKIRPLYEPVGTGIKNLMQMQLDDAKQEYEAAQSRYDTTRNLTIGLRDDVSWRIRIEPGVEQFVDLRMGPQQQEPAAQSGDLLVRDRLGNWTYQWAATIDDFLQGVTHVIRGEDLLDSTGRQIRLARLAGRQEPAQFLHHALIMSSTGRKLSKSDGATGIRELRARGVPAADVLASARGQWSVANGQCNS